MSRWVEARVVANKYWTDRLYSLQLEADEVPFEAGQFGRLALDIDDKRVARPYSFVNAPHERPYEFYSITVPDGPLSNRLHALQPGDTVWLAVKGSGFFTLSEVPEAKHLWMLSTGTALGPFLSILKTKTPWQRFEKIVLVHAVRHAEELAYRDTIDAFSEAHNKQFTYIPFVSREDTNFAIRGRIPAAIEDGQLEEKAGIKLTTEDTQIMLCGNPDMVKDTRKILEKRGFRKNRRKEPGHITTENYW